MSNPTDSSPEFKVSQLFSDLAFKAGQLRVPDAEIGAYLAECFVPEHEWNRLALKLQEEAIEEQLERTRARVQDSVRNKMITDWLNQNCPSETESVRQQLNREITFYGRKNRLPELNSYLQDVLKVGYKRAEKNWKRKRSGRWWSYIWGAVVGLLRVCLSIAILMAAQNKFESITFAILIMIYNSVSRVYPNLTQFHNEQVFSTDVRFKVLRELLRQQVTEDEREEESEQRLKLYSDMTKESKRHYIRAVFDGLIWLIAVGVLIYALV